MDWRFCQAQVQIELWISTSSVLEKFDLNPFLATQVSRWRTSELHFHQKKHGGDMPLSCKGSSRFAFHCEGVEWSNVQTNVYSIATLQEACGLLWTTVFCLIFQQEDKVDGSPLTSAGCWKASATAIGAQIKATGHQRAVESMCSLEHISLEALEHNGWSACQVARLNYML